MSNDSIEYYSNKVPVDCDRIDFSNADEKNQIYTNIKLLEIYMEKLKKIYIVYLIQYSF